ncbi:MAG TPA: YezD family protein [Terriglobia bacterium]|nr:YezD family protein [Terriglobia bacterium]
MSDPRYNRVQVSLESQIDAEMLKNIVKAVDQINYGSVEIVIHDSRIVQIERKERIRFDSGIARERS